MHRNWNFVVHSCSWLSVGSMGCRRLKIPKIWCIFFHLATRSSVRVLDDVESRVLVAGYSGLPSDEVFFSKANWGEIYFTLIKLIWILLVSSNLLIPVYILLHRKCLDNSVDGFVYLINVWKGEEHDGLHLSICYALSCKVELAKSDAKRSLLFIYLDCQKMIVLHWFPNVFSS